MASYNHSRYIEEAIKSVIDQTFQDFEFIITDDGSSDNSFDVIKSFEDKRIKSFRLEKNEGAAYAMNYCINQASGEYIAVINSDDIFMPNKLEVQLDFLSKHKNIGAVFSYAKPIDQDGNIIEDNHFYTHIFNTQNISRLEWLKKFFYYGNCLCHPSVLIRKSVYDHIGLYDNRFAILPDLDFWIRLCSHYDIFVLPEQLIQFRIHRDESNASGNRPDVLTRSSLELVQILQHYRNEPILKDAKSIFNSLPKEYNINITEYYIAQDAIKINHPAYKYFGISLLYDLFSNPHKISDLQKDNIRYIDLIKITGLYDVFGFTQKQNNNEQNITSHLKEEISRRDDIIAQYQKQQEEHEALRISNELLTRDILFKDTHIQALSTHIIERTDTIRLLENQLNNQLNDKDMLVQSLQNQIHLNQTILSEQNFLITSYKETVTSLERQRDLLIQKEEQQNHHIAQMNSIHTNMRSEIELMRLAIERFQSSLLFRIHQHVKNFFLIIRNPFRKPITIRSSLDVPVEHDTIPGVLTIAGWAYDIGNPIKEIKVFINDTKIGNVQYGLIRGDVLDAFPDITDPACGFAGKFSIEKQYIDNTAKKIRVEIATAKGSSIQFERNVHIDPLPLGLDSESNHKVTMSVRELMERIRNSISNS